MSKIRHIYVEPWDHIGPIDMRHKGWAPPGDDVSPAIWPPLVAALSDIPRDESPEPASDDPWPCESKP